MDMIYKTESLSIGQMYNSAETSPLPSLIDRCDVITKLHLLSSLSLFPGTSNKTLLSEHNSGTLNFVTPEVMLVGNFSWTRYIITHIKKQVVTKTKGIAIFQKKLHLELAFHA
jgi:hypothetical protein